MEKARPLTIRIKKNADGRTSLSCVRPDGTTTWQRQEGRQAAFFPRHDLTHYAVETVFGHTQAFYGLVAAGWEFSDFGNPWPRGRLPMEANVSERIVGFLDLERGSGELGRADDLNALLKEFCDGESASAPPPISDYDLNRVRQMRGELFSRWDAVAPGDALELAFPPHI